MIWHRTKEDAALRKLWHENYCVYEELKNIDKNKNNLWYNLLCA
jgi:hypothetical protein